MTIDRRAFLAASAGLFAPKLSKSQTVDPTLESNPFTLGVASGDPTPNGFILWTRLATDPLNGGGMPNEPITVSGKLL